MLLTARTPPRRSPRKGAQTSRLGHGDGWADGAARNWKAPVAKSGMESGPTDDKAASQPKPLAFLWGALLLGGCSDVYLLIKLSSEVAPTAPPSIVLPARIFLLVNAYRCVFPNRYNGNTVLHDHWLSSILLTRALATISEMAWIWQLAAVCRALPLGALAPLGAGLSWAMVGLCAVAQVFAWLCVASGTTSHFLWEEACWAALMLINTGVNWQAGLQAGAAGPPLDVVVRLSLVFGALYVEITPRALFALGTSRTTFLIWQVPPVPAADAPAVVLPRARRRDRGRLASTPRLLRVHLLGESAPCRAPPQSFS